MSAAAAQDMLTFFVLDDYDDGPLMLRLMLESKIFRISEAANGRRRSRAARRECLSGLRRVLGEAHRPAGLDRTLRRVPPTLFWRTGADGPGGGS